MERKSFFRAEIQVVNHICARLFGFVLLEFMLAFRRTTFKELYVVQKLTTAGNSMIAFKAFLLLLKSKLFEFCFKASELRLRFHSHFHFNSF